MPIYLLEKSRSSYLGDGAVKLVVGCSTAIKTRPAPTCWKIFELKVLTTGLGPGALKRRGGTRSREKLEL